MLIAARFWRVWLVVLAMMPAVMTVSRAAGASSPPGEPLVLSAEERAWVTAHPRIRVGFDPGWPPFSQATAGGGAGIDLDLLRLFGQRLGLEFEFVTKSSWPEVYASAQRGEMDVLVGTTETADRARSFRFSRPYFSFPVVIVTRNDEAILWSLLDLTDRRIVGVEGYAITTELARQYPALRIEVVKTVQEAMDRVSDGQADAFITNLPNASFEAKTRGLTNLKIAGVLAERFDLSYAVRPDWPELVALLDRAIASLTEAERQAVVHPWIRVDYEKVIRWDLVWKTALVVVGVLGLVIGIVVYRNWLLARELAERIRLQKEIKEAHDELVVLNQEKTELLQMAAHDLRGPLTGIQLAIDSSLRLNAVPGPAALAMIEKQVKQMTALLNDLLDVEALEHGRREIKLERVQPEEIVKAAIAGLVTMAENKEIALDVCIAEALPAVAVDPTAMRQIADNLISNALKFSPRGSTVKLVLQQRDAFVRLEVRDQGPGVRADETERIFAKYVRGSARPTAGEKSTGLGLSIVRQLASALNARVWCESRAGEGGFFVLMIPIAR